jgi:hypothetical protein
MRTTQNECNGADEARRLAAGCASGRQARPGDQAREYGRLRHEAEQAVEAANKACEKADAAAARLAGQFPQLQGELLEVPVGGGWRKFEFKRGTLLPWLERRVHHPSDLDEIAQGGPQDTPGDGEKPREASAPETAGRHLYVARIIESAASPELLAEKVLNSARETAEKLRASA